MAERTRICSVLAASVAILVAAVAALAQDACLEAHVKPRGDGFQNFGRSVAAWGDTVIVGAHSDNIGSVYVYDRTDPPEQWTFSQKLTPKDGQIGDEFGRSLALGEQTALIAATGHVHHTGTVVYAFGLDPDSGTWIEEQELFASDGVPSDFFGVSLAISGRVAIVGASFDDDNGAQSGSAYVFRYDDETAQWFEEQKLTASDGEQGNFFGDSVAISGDCAVVGAINNADVGAVYAFRFDAGVSNWVEEQKLVASDAGFGDSFGSAVSISGDRLLIGAPHDGSGSAYVFERDWSTRIWLVQEKLVPTDVEGSHQFGQAVDLDADVALIGAWRWSSTPGGLDVGSAYLFRKMEGGRWGEQAQLFGSELTFFFGRSVALERDTVVVGANGENAQAGAAYIFDVALNCDCPADADVDGSVGIRDLILVVFAWGTDDTASDVNGDGIVDVLDLVEVILNWGPCP